MRIEELDPDDADDTICGSGEGLAAPA